MAVKGAKAKVDITKKILEIFPGSFTYAKEIRIPYKENDVEGQIKVVLTAAKQVINNDEEIMVSNPSTNTQVESIPIEPTDEEKARLKTLIEKLGIE